MWSEKRKFGNTGEDMACKFLMKQGFSVIERNYLKKCGEIDIVAKDSEDCLRFVEVKTVSADLSIVSPETCSGGEYRPEDNVHPAKMSRLANTVETYLIEKGVSDETDWQIDLVTVFLDLPHKLAKAELLENIGL